MRVIIIQFLYVIEWRVLIHYNSRSYESISNDCELGIHVVVQTDHPFRTKWLDLWLWISKWLDMWTKMHPGLTESLLLRWSWRYTWSEYQFWNWFLMESFESLLMLKPRGCWFSELVHLLYKYSLRQESSRSFCTLTFEAIEYNSC